MPTQRFFGKHRNNLLPRARKGMSMKRLTVAFMVGLIALAGPMTAQPWADDAHHPEKAAKAKKPSKARPKQPQKKPAVKPAKSKQSEIRSPRV